MVKKIKKVKGVKHISEVIKDMPEIKKGKVNKKPQLRHKLLLKRISENIRKGDDENNSVYRAMKELGYSDSYAKSSTQLKDTRSWQKLVEEELPDSLLAETHKKLLNFHKGDHMTFPPYFPDSKKDTKRKKKRGEELTDDQIIEFLESVNCKVKRIVHGDMARHVYFWAPDGMIIDKALDKGYKLKGKYAPETMNVKFGAYTKEQLVEMLVGKVSKK